MVRVVKLCTEYRLSHTDKNCPYINVVMFISRNAPRAKAFQTKSWKELIEAHDRPQALDPQLAIVRGRG